MRVVWGLGVDADGEKKITKSETDEIDVRKDNFSFFSQYISG